MTTDFYIYAAGLALICFYAAARLRHELQMLQQNSYRIDRYWRWLKLQYPAGEFRVDDFTSCLMGAMLGGFAFSQWRDYAIAAVGLVCLQKGVKLLMVHFLYPQMWAVIKPYLGRMKVIIYCHGWEIQPWHRRAFNYASGDLEGQRRQSEMRAALWRDVFATALNRKDIHFVFVSQYLADEVMEDHRVTLPAERYSVIHNVIDTQTFAYTKKSAEQRRRILALAPYTANNYARDIVTQTILELSKDDGFSAMRFTVAGTGPMWEALTLPLLQFPNVRLENRFFTHAQIAALHREHGVFLAPSRCDTQGVSRDEAMASGLVPVVSAVTAVPEFVDDACGVLCPPQDVRAMADGVRKLSRDPELFLALSQNAAARVRRQSAPDIVIPKEMALFERMAKLT